MKISIKKKDWIQIVLHIAFWVGVFYTLLSFTEPHIRMRINQNGAILEKDIRRTLSPHIFLTLGFMVVLFYSNIFWLFKRALRYKNVLIRVVLPIAWFSVIFLANNYLDALLPAQKKNDPILVMRPLPPERKRNCSADFAVRVLRHETRTSCPRRSDTPTHSASAPSQPILRCVRGGEWACLGAQWTGGTRRAFAAGDPARDGPPDDLEELRPHP